MRFVNMLDEAMHNGCELEIKTKSRGAIVGIPDAVDEFDTDENRLGYYLAIGEHNTSTVFLDEITDIRVIPRTETQAV
jgi:hypothetical protein